jgi:outer membrane protein assembly factor BamD (BamD/ComL family)
MSQLKEESQAVMAARQALRSNDAGRALHLLEQAQVRFKRGALTEEREALTIEALAKTGQSAQASARAQAFLAQYPRSPHAADVQRFIAK